MGENDPPEQVNSEACREPTLQDLVSLCDALNRIGAKYIIVGGFAIRAAGFARQTMDIDLLVQTGVENEQKVIQALLILPDKAAAQLQPGDVEEFGVVRVADEILIDLMRSGCGVNYEEAMQDVTHRDVEGVRIPFASPETLWRMKQTYREKDIPDRMFLARLLGKKSAESPDQPGGWWKKFFD